VNHRTDPAFPPPGGAAADAEAREPGGALGARMRYKTSSRLDPSAAERSSDRRMLGEPGAPVDRKPRLDEHVQIVPQPIAEPTRPVAGASKAPGDLRAPRADATWQASSFDLAEGLDVKVMQSKLSPETLDRLFRG